MSMFGIIVSGRLVNFLSLVFVANIVLSFYVDYVVVALFYSVPVGFHRICSAEYPRYSEWDGPI